MQRKPGDGFEARSAGPNVGPLAIAIAVLLTLICAVWAILPLAGKIFIG